MTQEPIVYHWIANLDDIQTSADFATNPVVNIYPAPTSIAEQAGDLVVNRFLTSLRKLAE